MTAFINSALTRGVMAVAGLKARLTEERGQDLMEYAVLGGVLAVLVVGVGTALALTGAATTMANAIAECIDFDNVCP